MSYFLPLNHENVNKVAQIDEECFTGEHWNLKLFQDEIEDSLKLYFVAYDENTVVGFGGMTQILDEGHIMKIAVTSNYRGRGIGREILTSLIENGVKNGLKSFTLEVRVSNIIAQRLYESLGFTNVGIRKKFYPDKEDAYIYWLYK